MRVALGDAFGMADGAFVEGQMVELLRRLGGDYVLDTNFAADLTICEEAAELIERITKAKGPLPQFTSCCPAWVRYCETFHPEMIPHISSAKSPIGMQGSDRQDLLREEDEPRPKAHRARGGDALHGQEGRDPARGDERRGPPARRSRHA
ncbi:MAG: [Fe-Fe] hydrogenase large subunit C-terminal domain-containing protein [Sutterella wadsworthensis]